MRVNLTIKNISMCHAQKICRYVEKQGITDDEEDIEIQELRDAEICENTDKEINKC